jgi:hypothetical protein
MERRASPPVEADAAPAAAKEEDTLTSFRERVWAGEDARRSIDNSESIHELVVAAERRTSNPRFQIGCT